MYKCSNCDHTMSYPQSRCPGCGVILAGVRCSGCGHTDTKETFINNNHRCPKCGSAVYSGGGTFDDIIIPKTSYKSMGFSESTNVKAESDQSKNNKTGMHPILKTLKSIFYLMLIIVVAIPMWSALKEDFVTLRSTFFISVYILLSINLLYIIIGFIHLNKDKDLLKSYLVFYTILVFSCACYGFIINTIWLYSSFSKIIFFHIVLFCLLQIVVIPIFPFIWKVFLPIKKEEKNLKKNL